MQIMSLARLQRVGHSPIALLGGGTGLIGDPSGKTVERTLQSRDVVDANVRGIRSQLERFLDFSAPSNAARLVDNGEWLNTMSAMEFLRDVGKYFTVNYLLAKESVKRRLESEEGISYTEFSYSLLQAYDFLVLHDRLHVPPADGRQRSMGQHRRRLRPDPQAPGDTGARVSSRRCSRQPVERNSARLNRAPCGSIRRVRRRSASISSG